MEVKKNIRTIFSMSFPAMSVYEFEFLKEEKEVLEFWKSSSIYLICQRPVLYFDDLEVDDGIISMKIKQRGREKELKIKLAINEGHRYSRPGNSMWVDMHFYQQELQSKPPFKNIAGIKLLDENKNFIVWLTPERLIYEYVKNGLQLDIEGDFHEFITYNVHYIGQAQNQDIWERLTGHEKLSKVLAVEHPFIEGEFSPYELTLIFLQLESATEVAMLSIKPELIETYKNMSETEIEEVISEKYKPFEIDDIRNEIINDFEAYFINFLEPKYNKILFKNYPDIKNGLKQLGYSEIIHHAITFAILKTEEGTLNIRITPIYAKK